MTELAFPEITDAPRADVATIPTATLKDTALASFVPIEAHMRTLAARYANVAYDVATPKGMKDAKAARLVLRDEGRYAVQRLQKRLKDEANDLKRTLDSKADELIAITMPVEAAIDGQITAEETRKEAEREEKARIERERVAALEAKLAGLSVWIERCKAPGMTAERIASGIQMLVDSRMGDDWDEFQSRAVARKIEVVDVMRELHAQAVVREAREAEARAEAARLEAQRLENERVAAEQRAEAERLAEQQRLLAEQAAELQRKAESLAEQERAAAQARAEKEAADREQAAFDVWADRVRPSGDVTDVHIQWEASEDYAELHGIEYQPLIAAIAAKGEADPAPAVVPAEAAPNNELMGGVCASLNGWPGNQGTVENTSVVMAPQEYRGNSGAHDGGERPAPFAQDAPIYSDYIQPSSTVDEPRPQTEAEIQAANGPEVDPLPSSDPVWGDRATVSMADINARLGDGITLTSDFLRLTLQIKTAGRERAAYRFYASDWPSIRAGLIDHIEARA